MRVLVAQWLLRERMLAMPVAARKLSFARWHGASRWEEIASLPQLTERLAHWPGEVCCSLKSAESSKSIAGVFDNNVADRYARILRKQYLQWRERSGGIEKREFDNTSRAGAKSLGQFVRALIGLH